MSIQDFKGTMNGVVPNQIIGDGTAGRVLRCINFIISDGVGADTIRVTIASLFNGDTQATTADIAKGATVGNFNLSTGGSRLKWYADGIPGTLVAILSTSLTENNSNLVFTSIEVAKNGADIDIYMISDNNASIADMTTIKADGSFFFTILYLTSA